MHARIFCFLLLTVYFVVPDLAADSDASLEPFTYLMDTGTSVESLKGPEFSSQVSSWSLVPEEMPDHEFAGDVALMNDKVGILIHSGGKSIRTFSRSGNVFTDRAMLSFEEIASSPDNLKVNIIENSLSRIELGLVFRNKASAEPVFSLDLEVGRPYLHIRNGHSKLKANLHQDAQYAVLPDFFADDIVINPANVPVDKAELPSENFLVNFTGDGNAIVMCVWKNSQEDIVLHFAEANGSRNIARADLICPEEEEFWIAILEHSGIWHKRDVTLQDTEKVIPLDWNVPFPAQWRVDWQCTNGLIDSWEMVTENPDGSFKKHGWLGTAEAVGTGDWMDSGNRRRWTTVLGWFWYPCWMDLSGKGYLQPFSRKVTQFDGPTLIYPINRIQETPLDRYTVVDIVRNTLGVGPCEYILDVEGQAQNFHGIATCTARDILNEIYAEKRQRESQKEIDQALDDVLAFMKHIRGRIEQYVQFARETKSFLEEQKKSHPNYASQLDEIAALIGKVEENYERRKPRIRTPEYAEGLVQQFRTEVRDYEGEDALAKCKEITNAIVRVGDNQDELVGESRMAVKLLRQKAGLMAALHPEIGDLAREIRNRTQAILRNPASYEAPRH
ncbi:MAG TPA: hypothetical protein PLG59_01670 [bacterium]|nr:hypothetical protein [bacterium]HQO33339.1 hypothetical protein [bacterium]HQP99048.1 hypothetical protein [bacterium]